MESTERNSDTPNDEPADMENHRQTEEPANNSINRNVFEADVCKVEVRLPLLVLAEIVTACFVVGAFLD